MCAQVLGAWFNSRCCSSSVVTVVDSCCVVQCCIVQYVRMLLECCNTCLPCCACIILSAVTMCGLWQQLC